MAEDNTIELRLASKMTDAIEQLIGAVAAGAASAANQATAGAQGTVGGAGAEAGLSSQGVTSDVGAKVDVSVPEAIESLNIHTVKDVAERNKANSQFYNSLQSSNAKLYDVTATALGLATLGATHNMTLQQQMASDHRDQNHDRQINVNETDAYSVLGIATMVERLRNPTPVEGK